MKAPNVLAPLGLRRFRFLLLGRSALGTGYAMASIALVFAVLDLSGSIADLGIVVAARSVASIVFALIGGVAADRLPRHLIIFGAATVAAAINAAMAALVLTHSATVASIAVLSAAGGIVNAVTYPAASSLLPDTVPVPMRQQANALMRFCINSSTMVGASVGGVITATLGPGKGLAVTSVVLVAAPICFALVGRSTTAVASIARGNPFADFRDGWRTFVSIRWILVISVAFLFFNAAEGGGVRVLGPAVADKSIGRAAWGLVLAAETIGMVFGALIALRLRARRLLVWGASFTLVSGGLLVALAVAPQVHLLIVCAFLEGAAIEAFIVAWDTSVQQTVPSDQLARIYSIDGAMGMLALPLGQVAAGPVSELIGVKATLLAAAGIMLAATLTILSQRSVRRLVRAQANPANASEPVPNQ